jgi:hypothetical protein
MPIARWIRGIEWLVMAAILVAAWWFLLVTQHIPSWWKTDVDLPAILTGLATAGDGWGWHWWHGTWAQESLYPYWRPLISQIWLVELRLIGPDWEAWRWVNYALHLGIMFALWGFVARLTRSRFAGFVSALTTAFVYPRLRSLLGWWPLQTSLFSDLGILIALWAFLLWLDRRSRLHLALTLFAFAAAVTCREIAFVTPLLALAVAWSRRRPLASWPLFALAGGLWLYRTLVLSAAGAPQLLFGWSFSAPARMARALLGPIGNALAGPLTDTGIDLSSLWQALMAIILGVATVLAARSRRQAGLGVALLAVLIIAPLTAWPCFGRWEAGLFSEGLWRPVVRGAVTIAVAAMLWKSDRRREFLAAYAIVVILYLPTAGRQHAHHQYELLITYPLLYGVAIAAFIRHFRAPYPRITAAVAGAGLIGLLAAMFASTYRPALTIVPDLVFSSAGPWAILGISYLALRDSYAPGGARGAIADQPPAGVAAVSTNT